MRCSKDEVVQVYGYTPTYGVSYYANIFLHFLKILLSINISYEFNYDLYENNYPSTTDATLEIREPSTMGEIQEVLNKTKVSAAPQPLIYDLARNLLEVNNLVNLAFNC